ncbi:MAG: class I SAM-dependent methyltransferase [Promethearchaeota archaeon]|jgi:2-polyprenyl-3-methyl-5-hydroxy-6-metoxy-1,4-benzoquinol methylase
MPYKAKKVYQDQLTAFEYDKRRFRGLKGHLVDLREKNLIYKAIRLTGATPPSKILDIPCGTGRLSVFLAEKGFQVDGGDISEAMIEQANLKLENSFLKKQIKFNIADAESLPFSDSSFDIVVSLRFFGHLPPEIRKNILKEFARVTGSFLVVSYYHKNSIQGLVRKRMRAKNEIYWHPVNLGQIDEELMASGLKRVARFFLSPGVSETTIVLAEKLMK